MSSVDRRVVEARFDNKQFESGVKTSLKTLDRLKKGLNMEESAKSLSNLDQTARGISFATLSNGVESVSVKFSALGVIAITALQNITNSAINAGKRIVSALTIDPIKEGYQEYELKMNSIQTIMLGTGESLETVSKKLNELNDYADRTIYSFSDMTSNIGKFTNAGVGLDKAVGAIQGVSNAAALSGANTANASHAMYNFAQALASGYVKLIDWKSIETANMATVEFKTQLLESAVAAGTLEKATDGMYRVLTTNGTGSNMKETISATKDFNDSLAYQWMTTEVLVNTLNDYADETTDIGKRAFKAATEVKTFTQLFDTMKEAVGSGWASTWEIIIGNFDEAKKVLTEISQAFESFVEKTTDARNNLLQTWKDLGGRTALIDSFRNAIQGIISIIKPVKEAFQDIFPPVTAERLLSITERIRDITEQFKLSESVSNKLKSTFRGFFAIIDIGKTAFEALGKALVSVVKYFLPVGDSFLSMTGSFGEYLVVIRDVIKESDIFNRIFSGLGKILEPVAELVKSAVTKIFESIASFKNADTSGIDEFGQRIERGFKPFTFIAKLVKGVVDLIIHFTEKVGPLFKGLANAIGKGLHSLRVRLADWFNNLDFSKGLDIFNAGVFAAMLVGMRKFTKKISEFVDKGAGVVGGIKDIIGGITGVFSEFQSKLKADVLMKIAGAIALLTAALVVLTMVDADQLGVSLLSIGVLFTELFASMAIFEKVIAGKGFKGINKITFAMIALSISVLTLSAAVKKLADLEWGDLIKGLMGTAALMGMLAATTKALSSISGNLMKGAVGFIFFATSLIILTKAVKKLGEMDTGDLIKGLVGVGVLLTSLGIFMNTVDLDGLGVLKGIGIMAFATALVILSKAVEKLGALDTGSMIQGLIGLGVVLAEIGVFLNMTGDVKKVMSTAVGLTILATALVIFSKAIKSLGQMNTGELVQGLLGLGGALAIMVVALNALQGALGGAAALLIVAGALAILTPALKILGGMSLSEIGKSLLVLAGTFAIFGVAGMALAPAIPVLLGLSASILALGVAVALIGGGVMLLATALGALAVAGTAGVAALVLAVTSLIGLIPMFITQVANAIIAFAKIIGEAAPALIDAVANVIIAIAEAIIKAAPKVAEAVVVLVKSILKAVEEIAPQLGESLINIFVGLVNGVIKAVKDLLGIHSPSSVFKDIGWNIIEGFILGIKNGINKVVEWGKNIGKTIVNTVKKFLGIKSPSSVFSEVGRNVVAGLVQGISNKISDVAHWAGKIATTALESVKDLGKKFTDVGHNVISGFVGGVKNKMSDVASWGKKIGETVLNSTKKFLGIQSPSKAFRKEIAGNIGDGLTKGIQDIIPKVMKSSVDLGETTTTGAAKGIEKGRPKVVKTTKKTAKSAFEATKEWVDKQRKYHDLSLEAELSKWKETLKYYKEGQDEYYEILNHIADTENRMRQQSFEHSKSWIAKEKEMNRLSLFDELEAWERVQARYAEGTEQRKEADREYARVRGEIIEQMKQIDQEYQQGTEEINAKLIEDIQAVTEAYEKAVEDRANTIFRSFGLFDEVSMDEDVSGRDLIKNLQDQVNAIDLWASEFERLSKKGIDEGLLEELRNMGPKALPQLQALNKLTDRELSLYSDLWKTKMFLARTQAEKELESMKEDSKIKIEELRKQADKDLDTLKETWKTKTESITKTVVDEYKIMGDDIIKSLRALNNRSRTQFDQNNKDMKSIIHNEDWNSLGRYIVEGVSSGVNNHSSSLINAMIQLGRNAKKAMEDELGIQSPSKVFERIGQFTIEGLIEGLKDKKHMNVLSGVMNKITELIDGDMTLAPTIRPVLDMGGVTTDLNSAFSKEQLLRTRQSMQTANNISRTRRSEIPSTIDRTQHITEFNNEFVVHATIREEADVRKLSQELYSLQQQTSRGRGVR